MWLSLQGRFTEEIWAGEAGNLLLPLSHHHHCCWEPPAASLCDGRSIYTVVLTAACQILLWSCPKAHSQCQQGSTDILRLPGCWSEAMLGLWRSALKSVLCWHVQGKDKVKSRDKKSPKMWHCPLGMIPKHVLNDRKLGWVLFSCTSRKVQKLQVMRCERLSPVKHNPLQQNPRVSEQNLLYIDNCEYQDLCPWAFPFFFPMANWFFSTFGIYLMAFACCGFSVVCDPIISLWFSHLFWGYGSPSPTLLLLFQNFVSSETSPSALKLLETNKCI